jgi:hypothetical protein
MINKNDPPWLNDAAKALGEVTPQGEPLALNWTQVINAIHNLRNERNELIQQVEDLEAKFQQTYGCHHSWVNAEARQRKRADELEARLKMLDKNTTLE